MKTPVPNAQPNGWDDPYRPPRHPLRWLGSVLCLLFLYVFSVGPASALAARGKMSPVLMDRLYRPLNALSDASPQAQKVLSWYAGLWIAKTNPSRSKP